ncbi:MAG TPA: LysM domain-containing protein [Desulfosporosinus sp.]|nr:LysM domain-containing protein [Desulfosporosinus sp.]
MELRSVAYNPTQVPGMQGMQGMHGMPEMMPGMQGMPMAPGMYPPGGFVNLDVDADPGFVSYDVGGPMPCSPCGTPVMHHYQPCPMPTPTPAPAPKVYVVKKGDTVYKIAKRFGTTMESIILANNLRNPNLIYPGQILLIPTVSTGEFYG